MGGYNTADTVVSRPRKVVAMNRKTQVKIIFENHVTANVSTFDAEFVGNVSG